MVGSAIVRALEREGYHNFVLRTHKELNLCRQDEVEAFFEEEKPDYVFPGGCQGGRHCGKRRGAGRFYV